MIIHLNPNGLLVMDTCCFVNYCNRNNETSGKGNEVFNYKEIEKYLEKTGYKLVVTPYTMYECIQNCITPEVIARQRNAFNRAGEFWIVNMNHLLGESVSYQYGPDWVSEFDFENQEMFLRKRDFWKWRLYSSQTPKIRF